MALPGLIRRKEILYLNWPGGSVTRRKPGLEQRYTKGDDLGGPQCAKPLPGARFACQTLSKYGTYFKWAGDGNERALVGCEATIVPVANRSEPKGITEMKYLLKRLWQDEAGQDLIEYALLVALVALAATAGMNSLATAINTEFVKLGTSLTSAT